MPIRVIVIDDHPIMLKFITEQLSNKAQFEVVGTANHGSKLQRLVREKTPDVVILDLGMDTGNFEPITEVRNIMQEYPNLRIMVLTGYDDEVYIKHIIDAGALGYVLKSDNLSMSIPEGVQRVYEGRRYYSDEVIDKHFAAQAIEADSLTERELVALRLVAEGKSNSNIAQTMKIADKTVRNILSSAYDKLGIKVNENENTRVTAINKARELGLLKKEQ